MGATAAVTRYAKALDGFEARLQSARRVLRQAAQAHPGRVVLATSLGAEDQVLTDLIARDGLSIRLAMLDTGMLHPQTLALRERTQAHFGLPIEVFAPVAEELIAFTRENGSDVMRRSLQGRLDCCALRKLQPLQKLLAGRSAWVVGLRRGQSAQRAAVTFESGDADGRTKFAPLADWAQGDVWRYIGEQGLPYNALHDEFYPSIGCAPCTRAVALGEDERAGRWWWESEGRTECGLHFGEGSHHASDVKREARAEAKALGAGSHRASDVKREARAEARPD